MSKDIENHFETRIKAIICPRNFNNVSYLPLNYLGILVGLLQKHRKQQINQSLLQF
jgi:hypothetical protein